MGAATNITDNTSVTDGKYLCLTVLGYKKEGLSDEAYANHMINVSAPITKELMEKYGIVRWTQIHNTQESRALMSELWDPQMANVADFDCFSQVVMKSLEDYKALKQDPWYKQKLVDDHEEFADTKKSKMTIGYITQIVNDGKVVDGFSY